MKEKNHFGDLIKEISQKLKACFKHDETATQNAWWLLQAVAKKTKSELILEQNLFLTTMQKTTLNKSIHDLVQNKKPLAYIIGTIPFCDLTLFVQPPILIPRPETEEWVTNLICMLKKYDNAPLKILDIGTGTGCIGLALAKAFPTFKIVATDINKNALNLAKRNAKHNQISNITFIESDVFKNINGTFDVIVSNPPYIGIEELPNVDSSVLRWEDTQALIAPEQGDAILRNIIKNASDYLHHNEHLATVQIPQLILEVGFQQADRIQEYMKLKEYSAISIFKDSFGNNRTVSGRVTNGAFATT